MFNTALFLLALTGAAIDIPLKGEPLAPAAVTAVDALPGVERAEAIGSSLKLEVEAGKDVRLQQIIDTIGRHTSQTTIDADELAITSHTIFEMNAGQCFFCAEGPLGNTLARRKFVKKWAVVDYANKGRLRFRIDPAEPVQVKALGGDAFEDILFTDRYVSADGVHLYWPTGGVAWRPDEKTARREATASRRPLMIFPTAGT